MGFVAILIGGIARAIDWLRPEPAGQLQPIPVRVRDRQQRRRR